MKKAILSLAALCLIAGTAFKPAGGKQFEGVVTYDLDLKSETLPAQVMAMMQGSTMKMYTKGDKSRIEVNMGISSNTTLIDNKAKTAIALIDAMGQKYMIKSSMDDAKNASPKPEIKYVDGTKEIAGYKCKKAEIISIDKDGNKSTYEVYYTTDIPYNGSFKNGVKGLKGFPLEYTMKTPDYDMTMHYVAKSVSKESVSDDQFKVPEGYKETTREELMKEMGQ
jgi:GLPGLI family protein